MEVIHSAGSLLDQLGSIVSDINKEDYVFPSVQLSGSTIGQHVRHTLEFFVCLMGSYQSGIINYDLRSRDTQIETHPKIALKSIDAIKCFLKKTTENKCLKLEGSYNTSLDHGFSIETNYYRELIYNIEHSIHHMALIKIGIRELADYVEIPPHFGVASSTVRYKEGIGETEEYS